MREWYLVTPTSRNQANSNNNDNIWVFGQPFLVPFLFQVIYISLSKIAHPSFFVPFSFAVAHRSHHKSCEMASHFKPPAYSQKFPDLPQFSGFMKPCRFQGEASNLEVQGSIPPEN